MGFISKIKALFKRRKKDEYWFVPENNKGTAFNIDEEESPKKGRKIWAKRFFKSKVKHQSSAEPSVFRDTNTKKSTHKKEKDIAKNESISNPNVNLATPSTQDKDQKIHTGLYYDEEAAEKFASDKATEEIPIKGYTGMFEIKKSKDDRYVFKLYATNRNVIAISQIYSSSKNAMVGINSVIANAPRASIEDQTLKIVSPASFPKWEIYIDKAGQYRFRL